MSEGNCEQCRILLNEVSSAISAHVATVSLLAEAVSLSEPVSLLDRLRETVRATSSARETAVERYENHVSAHQLKVMTAGSQFWE
jgi:hypothetical protein